MDTNLKDIIKKIVDEYEYKDEKINSYIETLTKEYFIKLKDIKNMSEDDWKSLNLPKNLYCLIKEKYESTLNEEKNNSFLSQSLNSIGLNLSAPYIQLSFNRKMEEIIFEDLFLLFQQVNDYEIMSNILKKIFEILNNINQYPEKEKYKRINITKFLSKHNFSMIETFFLDIHFLKANDGFMYFKGNNEFIKSVTQEFIKFIRDNKINNIIENNIDNNIDKNIDNKTENKQDNKEDKTNNNKEDKNEGNKLDDKLDNTINKSSFKQDVIPNNEEMKLLNGSIEIKIDNSSNNKSNIKLYLYPKIVFSTEEENNSKVILLIGQTGEGKTTFINALVNIYSGITIEDDFRYLLVYDEDNSDQTKSKTKDVGIYNIRPKKGLNFPPLKVVDTPGFGDTNGIEEDQNHLRKLKKVFDEELLMVHSICFIINCTRNRIDFHQEYVFNTLMSLFAENVKKNFIVGVTKFFSSEEERPEVIECSLSLKSSFYYKCILEDVDINNSYWYFASDNKIISNNRIKVTDLNKIKWNQSENAIKSYIENKVKVSQEIKIKETQEVISKRIYVLSEIQILEKKINEFIDIKSDFEDEKKEEEEFLKKISEQKEILNKHQTNKENIEKNMEKIEVMMETLFDEEELNFYAEKYYSEGNYIDMIDNVKDTLNDKIKLLNLAKLKINHKIEKIEKKKKSNEIEIIKTLNQIKLYLDYLRKYSLNKDYSKSMEFYLNKLKEEVKDQKKKTYIEKLRKIYSQLIEIENIDFEQLSIEKYQEIKDKIIGDNN